jgi:hypothetical protein
MVQQTGERIMSTEAQKYQVEFNFGFNNCLEVIDVFAFDEFHASRIAREMLSAELKESAPQLHRIQLVG